MTITSTTMNLQQLIPNELKMPATIQEKESFVDAVVQYFVSEYNHYNVFLDVFAKYKEELKAFWPRNHPDLNGYLEVVEEYGLRNAQFVAEIALYNNYLTVMQVVRENLPGANLSLEFSEIAKTAFGNLRQTVPMVLADPQVFASFWDLYISVYDPKTNWVVESYEEKVMKGLSSALGVQLRLQQNLPLESRNLRLIDELETGILTIELVLHSARRVERLLTNSNLPLEQRAQVIKEAEVLPTSAIRSIGTTLQHYDIQVDPVALQNNVFRFNELVSSQLNANMIEQMAQSIADFRNITSTLEHELDKENLRTEMTERLLDQTKNSIEWSKFQYILYTLMYTAAGTVAILFLFRTALALSPSAIQKMTPTRSSSFTSKITGNSLSIQYNLAIGKKVYRKNGPSCTVYIIRNLDDQYGLATLAELTQPDSTTTRFRYGTNSQGQRIKQEILVEVRYDGLSPYNDYNAHRLRGCV